KIIGTLSFMARNFYFPLSDTYSTGLIIFKEITMPENIAINQLPMPQMQFEGIDPLIMQTYKPLAIPDLTGPSMMDPGGSSTVQIVGMLTGVINQALEIINQQFQSIMSSMPGLQSIFPGGPATGSIDPGFNLPVCETESAESGGGLSGILDTLGTVGDAIGGLWNKGKDLFSGGGDLLGGLFDKGKGFLSGIGGGLGSIIDIGKGIFSSFF